MTVQMSDSTPFWRGFQEGETRLPYCSQCREPHLPAGPVCPYCLSDALEWRPASGSARLSSWVIERKKTFEAFDPPYIVGEVQLAEGPRMPVQIDWAVRDRLRIDLAGSLAYDVAPNGLTLPRFVPEEG